MTQAYGKHDASAMGSATRHIAILGLARLSLIRLLKDIPKMKSWTVGKLLSLGGVLDACVNTISAEG